MSYCRWSSDNFQCDVYVYEDVNGGWTTHVAGRRYRGNLPEAPSLLLLTKANKKPAEDHAAAMKQYIAQRRAHSAALDACEMLPIGLSRDGKTFNSDTPGECADLLEDLRREGYNVPQYAIDELRSEQAFFSAPDAP